MTKIEELIVRVEAARTAPLGETLEQQQARENWIADSIHALDNELWSQRLDGETVSQVRARLAPTVFA